MRGLLLLFVVLLPSVSSRVTEEITLTSGNTTRIYLEGNPSTGYAWSAACANPNVVIVIPREHTKPDDPHLVGSPVTYAFDVRAMAPGASDVLFSYRRPWESSPLEVVNFHVTVTQYGV